MDGKTEYAMAVAGNKDTWVPACDGTETPFVTRTGRRLLWCYNPKQGKHAYLDLGTDTLLTDDEAIKALAIF